MRKIVTVVLTIFALQTNALYAWVGGPWSNNSSSGDVSGTYQGIIMMNNGSGMFRFAEGPEAQLSVFNVSSIFYKGIVYFGTCFAIVDTIARQVTGQTVGSSRGLTGASNNADPAATGGNIIIGPVDPGDPATEPAANASSSAGIAGVFGGVVGNCTTSWHGKITQTAPVIEFRADGQMFLYGDLDQQAISSTRVTNTRTVDQAIVDALADIGDAISGGGIEGITVDDLITLLNIASTTGESSISSTVGSGGQRHVFPDIGVQRKIWVFGSRLSYGRSLPITSDQTALTTGTGVPAPAGSGSGGFLF
jgi:hypothetical protein